MKMEQKEIRFVTTTPHHCVDCGFATAPAVLAYSHIAKSSGYYCLACYANASERFEFLNLANMPMHTEGGVL